MASLSAILTGNPTSRTGQKLTLAMCLVTLLAGILLAACPGRQDPTTPRDALPSTSATPARDAQASSAGIATPRFVIPLRVG
jgi:hypothetical protein